MARQLRIRYPGAFYHVTSRGNQKKAIYGPDQDMSTFLGYCAGAHEKFGAIIHTYCLMKNHYHFLLETPQANLSDVMHFINTSYAGYFNKKHSRVGHLFQGRFKAILVDSDSYARDLSRYIHLNPVRAGIVEDPGDYSWSSYSEFAGFREAPPWLCLKLVLGYFGLSLDRARSRYVSFVRSGLKHPVEDPLRNVDSGSILGSEAFIARVKSDFLQGKEPDREVPGIRALRNTVPLEEILRAVKARLGARNNLVRDVAIFLGRKRTSLRLRDFACRFEISLTAVSKIRRQMEERLKRDPELWKLIESLEGGLFGAG